MNGKKILKINKKRIISLDFVVEGRFFIFMYVSLCSRGEFLFFYFSLKTKTEEKNTVLPAIFRHKFTILFQYLTILF